MFFVILLIGCILGWCKSIIIISANLPGFKISAFCKPIAWAPLTVAIYNTSLASQLLASWHFSFWSPVTKNISLNISKALFDAGPSVPIAILIPISIIFWILAIPLANFVLDPGQVTTYKLRRLNISKSSSLISTQW